PEPGRNLRQLHPPPRHRRAPGHGRRGRPMSVLDRVRPEAAPPSNLPTALLPDDAPFTPAQPAGLNGFFAALVTPAPAPAAAPAAPRPRLDVLFASQTGTAEGLARKLARTARTRGCDSDARDLGTLALDELAGLGRVAVIASTSGEGEAPDHVQAFAARLTAAEGTPLAGLSFAVLALGDRNYARFCHFGALLDKRLAA